MQACVCGCVAGAGHWPLQSGGNTCSAMSLKADGAWKRPSSTASSTTAPAAIRLIMVTGGTQAWAPHAPPSPLPLAPLPPLQLQLLCTAWPTPPEGPRLASYELNRLASSTQWCSAVPAAACSGPRAPVHPSTAACSPCPCSCWCTGTMPTPPASGSCGGGGAGVPRAALAASRLLHSRPWSSRRRDGACVG